MHEYRHLGTYGVPFASLTLCLLLPIFYSNQIITGTLVNLVIAYASIRRSRLLPLFIILPSIGAIVHGALFGPLTYQLIILVPFIWCANYLFAVSIRQGVLRASLIKGSFLGAVTITGVAGGYLAPPFALFGLVQFLTAYLGGATAYLFTKTF